MSKIKAALAEAGSINKVNLSGDDKAHDGFMHRTVDAFKKDPGAFLQGLAVVTMAVGSLLNPSLLIASTASLAYMSNRQNINDTVKRIFGADKPKTPGS